MLEFIHWFTKFIKSKSFGCRQSSFWKHNVRQAARLAQFLFLLTFNCNSPAIFVYWKTYNSTDSVAVPKGEIFRIHFSELKKFRTDESIFRNSKFAFRLIKNKLFTVEFIFLNLKRWPAAELFPHTNFWVHKISPLGGGKNIFLRPFYWTQKSVYSRERFLLQLHCWLIGLSIYWLANVQNCLTFFIGPQSLSNRNLSR